MGGDHGPQVVYQAVSRVITEFSDVQFNLFIDDASEEDKYLSQHDRVNFIKCENYLKADESLAQILRSYKHSTMFNAISSVKNNEAHGVLTVGHTAPYFLLAKKSFGAFKNLKRLPLAVIIPSSNGHKILTDIGANLECSEVDLYQFGILAKQFATLLGIEDAGISLINVGHEENKGPAKLQNAAALFRKANCNFKGFIDSDKIFTCDADVIITDGFSGNCISKACEGTSRFILDKFNKYWIMRKLISRFSHNADRYNGAILLGIKGLCIKAHGSSQVDGLFSAIKSMCKLSTKYGELYNTLDQTDFAPPEL